MVKIKKKNCLLLKYVRPKKTVFVYKMEVQCFLELYGLSLLYIYIYIVTTSILTAIYAPTSTRLVIMPKSSNPLTFKIACIISSHLVALSLPSPGESFEPAEGAHQHPLSLPFSYNFKHREYRHLKCKPAFAVESEREALGGVGSVLSHESLRRIFYSVKVSELGLFHSSESHRGKAQFRWDSSLYVHNPTTKKIPLWSHTGGPAIM